MKSLSLVLVLASLLVLGSFAQDVQQPEQENVTITQLQQPQQENLTITQGLTRNFYASACPQVYSIVERGVRRAIQIQQRNAASLLRLFFHDCFVNGCDASLLLDDTPGFTGEKTATANVNSVKGFEFIDDIKAEVEAACPLTVSCADILAIVARDAVVLSGGPNWEVSLGRRDSLSASKDLANEHIPLPDYDLPQLLWSFQAVGLDSEDLVALLGAHTIGFSRCTSFTQRIYNQSGTLTPEKNIQPGFLRSLQSRCPLHGDPDTLWPIDWQTPAAFDNSYYKNVATDTGLFHSDESLWSQNHGEIRELVQRFNYNNQAFFESFASSIVKMGNIKPLIGRQGEVRKNCRCVNSHWLVL